MRHSLDKLYVFGHDMKEEVFLYLRSIWYHDTKVIKVSVVIIGLDSPHP